MWDIRQADDGTWELVDDEGQVLASGPDDIAAWMDANSERFEAEPPEQMHWEGVLAMEGVETGDGRKVEPGALTWEVPFPLTWQREGGGHEGAVTIGTVHEVSRRDGGQIYGRGVFDLGSEEGLEGARHVAKGLTDNVSMEPDSVTVELRVKDDEDVGMPILLMEEDDEEPETDEDGRIIIDEMAYDDWLEVMTDGRIRTVALVTTAAFDEAVIELAAGLDFDDLLEMAADEPRAVVAAAIGDVEVGDEVTWDDDGTERTGEIVAIDEDAETVDVEPDDDTEIVTLPVSEVDLVDDDDGDDEPDDEPEDDEAPEPAPDVEASMVAAGGPEIPPAGWFDDPQLDGPTPLTVNDDGRIFGHLAAWGTCHIGRDDTCLTPPESAAAYAYFATGETDVACDDGCDDGRHAVPTGAITLGTGHANLRADARDAAAHYDNTGTAVADVTAGEDGYGIWVAGALRPGLTDMQVRTLKASALSGDWRRIGGNLELVAALAVNVPGFPIPRSVAASGQMVDMPNTSAAVESGRQLSLVAAGPVRPHTRIRGGLSDTEMERRLSEVEDLVKPLKAERLRAAVHGRS